MIKVITRIKLSYFIFLWTRNTGPVPNPWMSSTAIVHDMIRSPSNIVWTHQLEK